MTVMMLLYVLYYLTSKSVSLSLFLLLLVDDFVLTVAMIVLVAVVVDLGIVDLGLVDELVDDECILWPVANTALC